MSQERDREERDVHTSQRSAAKLSAYNITTRKGGQEMGVFLGSKRQVKEEEKDLCLSPLFTYT